MRKFAISEIEEAAGTGYPAPHADAVATRLARRFTGPAGLTQFGVNQVRLRPGAWSSQRHWHSHEDEFVMILDGEATLITDEGETRVRAGDCIGFPAGEANGHHLVNASDADCVFLAIGTRSDADTCDYPDIDMKALAGRYTDPDCFRRKDGSRF